MMSSLPDSDIQGFFGFVSSSPNTSSVTVSSNGTSDADVFGFALDNFTFSQEASSAIPETGTFVLLLMSLSALGCLKTGQRGNAGLLPLKRRYRKNFASRPDNIDANP
jgi:hypothetical protein